MAYVIITSPENKLHKIVFKNMARNTAETIAAHMNKLAEIAAKKSGEATKRFIYKVVGK